MHSFEPMAAVDDPVPDTDGCLPRSDAPMFIVDRSHAVVAANDAASQLFGVPASGHPSVSSLVFDTSGERLLEAIDAVYAGEIGTNQLTLVLTDADGHGVAGGLTLSRLDGVGVGCVFWPETSVVPQVEMEDALFHHSPVAMREEDFTPVATWFERLRRRGVTDLDQHLLDHPGELIDTILQIKTVRVNRAMLDMMGASSIDEMNQHRRTEMTDEVLASFRREFITLWNGNSRHEAEFVGLNLAGEPFECRLTMSARVRGGEIDLSRVIVAIQDITKERAYQRSLENLIAGKDRFVASISHELRTPLAAVLGLSEELYTMWDAFKPEEAKELMGVVARSARDLAGLVEDLLLAAQMEVGNGIAARPQDFVLQRQVAAAIDDCISAGEMPAPPVIGEASDVWCHADPDRVRQILRNLLVNAARFGGGLVAVEVNPAPQPTVRVVDDGPGLPASEWERIFSPHQSVIGSDGARGALGLGLAISRQIAELMNGTLTYQYIGGRSIFTLTLPSAEAALFIRR